MILYLINYNTVVAIVSCWKTKKKLKPKTYANCKLKDRINASCNVGFDSQWGQNYS